MSDLYADVLVLMACWAIAVMMASTVAVYILRTHWRNDK